MKILKLILAVLTALCLSTSAFAADVTVEYSGHNMFGFGTGSEFSDTDLFVNFKGVMPGDSLSETVEIKNTAKCCDYIKLYIRAEVHGEENVPVSSENAVTMNDFLGKLTMRVKNGNDVIYESSPDESAQFTENVYLGTYREGYGNTITVELEVPIELGNEYANRIGEVDWILVAEEYDDAEPDKPIPDHPIINAPQTGEDFLYVGLFVLAVSMMIVIPILLRSRNRKSDER